MTTINLNNLPRIKFPDGQVHAKVDEDFLDFDHYDVKGAIRSFDDLFLLAQLININPNIVTFKITYLLGARSDDKFKKTDSIDLKIICDYINFLNIPKIQVVKPHSKLTFAYLDRATLFDPSNALVTKCIIENNLNDGSITVVTPDLGASKWVEDLDIVKTICKNPDEEVIQGKKKRNDAGKVIGMRINVNQKDRNYLIVDDLIDGGATFLELSECLKTMSPKGIYLVATHAIFSKGIDIFNGVIDRIYCTDSFATFSHPLVVQIKV